MPRHILKTLVLCAATLTAAAQQSIKTDSDSTATASTDTVLYPWQHPVASNSLGYQVTQISDDWTRHIYSGASAFNMLRGRTPGLSISPATPGATGGIRGSNTMWVIDGIPMNSDISAAYNLNSFDFATVTAAGAATTAMQFGAPAGEGVVAFRSRTGEGYDKSMFELSSVTSLIPGTNGALPGEDRWQFTNAIAYMKDFGPVDTRISYRFYTFPFADNDDGHIRNQSIRANTGVDIARNLTARLILDYGTNNGLQNFPANDFYPAFNRRSKQLIAQGNVILQYEPLRGLKLTTQHALTDLELDVTRSSPAIKEKEQQDRRSHNFVAAYERNVMPELTLGAFAGIEGEYASFDRRRKSETTHEGQWSNYKNQALFAGLTSRLRDFLSLDLTYREDGPSSFPGENKFKSWSASTSFVFSNAFSWTSDNFNSARIRMSYADQDFGTSYQLPFVTDNQTGIYTPLLSPSKNFEIGMDYRLFKNRVSFSATYFHDHDTRQLIPASLPWGPAFTIIQTKGRGWESLLSVNTISNADVKMTSALSWWAVKSMVFGVSDNTNADDGRDFPGGPYPTWSGAVHNTITIKDFLFINLLIDVNKTEYFGLISSSPPEYGIRKSSSARVNDLSVGVLLDEQKLVNLPVRALRVSLSGRNLITLHEKEPATNDVINPFSSFKSVSLALTASF